MNFHWKKDQGCILDPKHHVSKVAKTISKVPVKSRDMNADSEKAAG